MSSADPGGPMAEVLTESFCERCGTRYTFESRRPRVKKLTGVKVLSRGLKNFVLSDDSSLDEAMAAARSDTEREATSQQLDAFHQTFNFCMTCRQYTCGNCWNEAENTCLTCSPHLGHEIMPAPFPDLDPSLGLTVGLDTPGAVANGNGANGSNGHAETLIGADASAWPVSDLTVFPEPVAAESPSADVGQDAFTDAGPDIDMAEIDVAARMAALTAIGASPSASLVDDDVPAEAIVEPEPVVEAIVAEAIVAEPEVAAEPVAIVEPEPAASTAPDTTTDDVAAVAAAQTADLLNRFRPGQSLDAEIEAYEREQATTDLAVQPEAAPEPEPTIALADAVIADALAHGVVAADPEPVAATEPVVAEPEPVVAEPEPVAAAEPVVAVEPEPVAATEAVVAEPEPEPVAAAEPVVAVEPEPEPEPVAAAEPEPTPEPVAAEPAPPVDVVEQPTWRIIAPDVEQPAPVAIPPAAVPPTQPVAAATQPEWPAAPQWPATNGTSGLPFLGRPTQPTGGLDSLWAESNREVAATEPSGRPAAAGVKPCLSCGLSLSSTARFCRRCGSSQSG